MMTNTQIRTPRPKRNLDPHYGVTTLPGDDQENPPGRRIAQGRSVQEAQSANNATPWANQSHIGTAPANEARVTLTLPTIRRRSILDRYKTTAKEAPRSNTHRFVLQHLGLTEEAFENRVTVEVDDCL